MVTSMMSGLFQTRRNGNSIVGAKVLQNGMVVHDDGFSYVRRSTRSNLWRDVGKLILTFYGFKIAIIAMLGIPAIEVKITELEAGMFLERITAFLFKPDPITVDFVQWVTESFSLVPMMG